MNHHSESGILVILTHFHLFFSKWLIFMCLEQFTVDGILIPKMNFPTDALLKEALDS